MSHASDIIGRGFISKVDVVDINLCGGPDNAKRVSFCERILVCAKECKLPRIIPLLAVYHSLDLRLGEFMTGIFLPVSDDHEYYQTRSVCLGNFA